MSNARDVTKRLLAFGSLPLLSSLAPLLLLPLLSRSTGASGWASLLVAQSLGAFSAVVILFGWGVAGQARAASSHADGDQADLYRESVRTRTIVAAVVLPLGVVSTHALTGGRDDLTNVGMYLASACAGFTLTWFAIGRGRARWIATYEAIPKLVATAAAVPLVLITHSPWPYPAMLIVATLCGLRCFSKRFRSTKTPRPTLRVDLRRLREDGHAALAAITGSAYAAAPLPVAALYFSEAEVAGMASTDRLYRYGLFAVSALGNALLSWTLAHSDRRRRIIAVGLSAAIGALGSAYIATLGPFTTGMLFGEHVAGSRAISIWYALAYFSVSVATPLITTILIPAGKAAVVVVATATGAIVGIAGMVVLPQMLGIAGVSVGFGLSEALSMLILLPTALRALRLPAGSASSVGPRQESIGAGEGNGLRQRNAHRRSELPLAEQ